MPDQFAESGELLALTVGRCARCDGDHPDLAVTKFVQSVVISGRTFDYWAPCPTTGGPILVEVAPMPDVEHR